jgi:hypothetical protein
LPEKGWCIKVGNMLGEKVRENDEKKNWENTDAVMSCLQIA